MRWPVFTLAVALTCLACSDDGGSEGADEAETGSEGTGDTSTTSTDSTSSTGDTSTSTSTDDTGSTGDTGSGDTDTGDSSGETGPPACEPWQLICEFTGDTPDQIDCGIVGDNDDLASWQAAAECALDAAAMQVGFKVMGQVGGIDSILSQAYGAPTGGIWAPVHVFHDSFGPSATRYDCADIDDEPGCQVSVGDLCLRCVDAGEPELVCR